MATKLSNSTVEAVIRDGKPVNTQSRIVELQKELDKVKKNIAEQERLERRYATVQRAYAKLCNELGKTLTCEERQAIDGIYLFLHSGCVDMVRTIPSATSRGEDKALEKDLHTVEALKELESLTSEAK